MQLEKLLGEELFAQVKAKIDAQNEGEADKLKHIRFVDLSEGGYVSAQKYGSLETENQGLQQQVDTLTESLETLKKQNKGNETLQQTIDTLTSELETLQRQSEERSKTFSLKEAMTKAGVTDPDYLIYKSGGVDKFSFDKDGNPDHLEEALKPFRDDPAMAHLFQRPNYSPKGGDPPPADNPFAKDSYNLTKQGQLFKTNPQRARELAKIAGVKIE